MEHDATLNDPQPVAAARLTLGARHGHRGCNREGYKDGNDGGYARPATPQARGVHRPAGGRALVPRQ